MTAKEIEKSIGFVRFNMACEGFDLTDENEEICKNVLERKMSREEAIQYYISKYHSQGYNGKFREA